MIPVISKFLESNPDVKYTKIDIDKQPELSEQYEIKGVPTFIGMENGDVINRIMGAVPLAKIEGIFKDND
jgi:thioredoxin 1